MIKIVKNESQIKISGHALYAEKGKDIVCASVSSIIYTTVNGLLNINPKSILFSDNDEYMEIKIVLKDNITNALIENMMTLLTQLAKSYPKNVKVDIKNNSKGE